MNKLTFGANRKKKIDVVRQNKTELCKTICVCSLTSTIHLIVPMVKVLNRLGTVQIISEDKSAMLLSKELDSEFQLGDIKVTIIDELVLMEDDLVESLKEFNYNILITHDFLPGQEVEVDKYIMLNRRHHFRNQITNAKDRYTPIFSVTNKRVLSKEENEAEAADLFVNERLYELPSFAVCQEYLETLMLGKGSYEFKVNTKLVEFVTEAFKGIEGCQKNIIRGILLERGELFVSAY